MNFPYNSAIAIEQVLLSIIGGKYLTWPVYSITALTVTEESKDSSAELYKRTSNKKKIFILQSYQFNFDVRPMVLPSEICWEIIVLRKL